MKSGDFYDFGPFRLDARKHLLLRDGQPITLTPKALETLLLLVENSGRVLEKDELMNKLWPEAFVEEANLAQNISLLRKALGESPSDHHYVVTVPGRGYRFVAEVRRASEDADELIVEKHTVSRVIVEDTQGGQGLAAETTQIGEGEANGLVLDLPSAEGQIAAAVGVYPDRDRRRESALPARRTVSEHRFRRAPSVRWILALAGLVVGLAALLIALNVGGFKDRLLGRPNVGPIRSLAVLPLENLSGDPNQEYFADGMTDELITDLAKIGSLRVISRTSSMRYKRTQKPLAEIARELNVDAVVEGTVMRSGETVRITAQLIHTPSDRHLWADAYERRIDDAVVLQGEVAEAIADQVRVKLSPDERERLRKVKITNPMAHDSYLRGRFYLSEDLGRKAMDEFNRAISSDPTYAPAYAGLADTYSLAGLVYSLPPREAFPRAEAAAKKALELDEELADAHAALGYIELVYDLDWAASDGEFHRALSLNPNAAVAYECVAVRLAALGRRDEAIAAIRRALDCDPLSPELNAVLGWILYFARKYDQAIKQLETTLELNPEFGTARIFLGQAYEQTGQYDLAIAQFQKMKTDSQGSPTALAALAHTYAVAGKAEAARKTLEETKVLSRRTPLPPSFVAAVYAGLGQKAEAFVNLKKAFAERDSFLIYVNVDPRYDPLHSDPRFQDLVRRIGLPP